LANSGRNRRLRPALPGLGEKPPAEQPRYERRHHQNPLRAPDGLVRPAAPVSGASPGRSTRPAGLAGRHRWLVRLVGRVYSRWAGRYDAVVTHRLLPLIVPGGRDAVARWLSGERPAPPVLDLPTGTGQYLGLLPAPNVGVDLAPGMLAAAKTRHPGAAFVQGDAYRLPFRDGSFTTVVTILGLHLFPRPAAAVPEMTRVLRPGGVLLGAVPLAWPYLPTPRALRRILDVPGLHLEHFERRRFLVVFRARRPEPAPSAATDERSSGRRASPPQPGAAV